MSNINTIFITYNRLYILVLLLPAIGFAANQLPEEQDSPDLTALSMEALMELDVSSVTKKSSGIKDVPAAIYVLTAEEIQRTGATTIPEALRVVPGLHVARINGNRWAVTARGFNSQYANKLLVLMDGRSLYSPMFSGVWWDQEDIVMDDIDRIEVIRGPGASLWGANAVNGVINIISKKTKNTQGGLVSGYGGTVRKGGSLRYGVDLGNEAYLKVYGRQAEFDGSTTLDAKTNAGDDARLGKLGFRLDKDFGITDKLTLQGDFFSGFSGGADQNIPNTSKQWQQPVLSQPYFRSVTTDSDYTGHYLLSRWEHRFSTDSSSVLRMFWNSNDRKTNAFNSSNIADTWDVDFQHNYRLNQRHNLIWGIGSRLNNYMSFNGIDLALSEKYRLDDIYSAFGQDEIILMPERWKLILGSKFEHHPVTGFEWQPNARIAWTPSKEHSFWASISRSVRTPNWAEQDICFNNTIYPSSNINPLVTLVSTVGNKNIKSEKLIAYELGWRGDLTRTLSADVAFYYFDYDNVVTVSPKSLDMSHLAQGYLVQTVNFTNFGSNHVYGGEASLDWRVADTWKLRATYSQSQQQFGFEGDKPPSTVSVYENSYPRDQAMLWTMHQLTPYLNLDLNWRFVNNLSVNGRAVGSYHELDARLGWNAGHNIELAVIGRNLINDQHQEFGEAFLSVPTAIQREVYATVGWKF